METKITLFTACPMCGFPLAYGGPSCKTYFNLKIILYTPIGAHKIIKQTKEQFGDAQSNRTYKTHILEPSFYYYIDTRG